MDRLEWVICWGMVGVEELYWYWCAVLGDRVGVMCGVLCQVKVVVEE